MPTARRISLALKSLRVLSRALETLPHSNEKADVLDGALECMEAIEVWRKKAPTTEENERMMGRIIKLHVAATSLRRR